MGHSVKKDWRPWLVPQHWVKQRSGPAIALGESGQFDDMHIFAPCVGKEGGHYYLWYPGSRGEVAQRVFRLGLATSKNAVEFKKIPQGPVLEFGDGQHSLVTPTVLRETDGSLIRENGKLRMWFSAQDLTRRGSETVLHEVTGTSPDRWNRPSPPLLENCYGPTVVKEDDGYRMWFADVSLQPWVIRHARSKDGKDWIVTKEPAITVDSRWKEKERLVHYPAVVKADSLYLMWYSSRYWWDEEVSWHKTAINFAVSEDGVTWHKHPDNPVLRPDPALPWEACFNSSHCVVRMGDGTWRIWYGGRKEPPWVNQYFSICTATWRGPS
jgi:predicted GH43/DUF377 family glycosyl hydrolase